MTTTDQITTAPSRAATPALSVRGLTKRYGQRTAVDHLDIEVPTGVVAGFVGPNGAGKTTTMAMLLGLVRPTDGSGTVLGEPIDHPDAYLHRVGALIESPAFYPALTGAENLRMFATVGGHPTEQIPALLAQVGLGDRGDDRYRSYSLGMKQRLGIAAALLGDPELLILDEPANGLDPQGVREMRSLIGDLAHGGRTVLVSSHDLSELEQVCDWLVLIDTGRSLYQGLTSELLGGVASGLAVVPERPADRWRLRELLFAAGHHVDERDDRLVVSLDATGGAAGRVDTGEIGTGGIGTGGIGAAEIAAAVNRIAFAAGIVLVELSPLRTTLEDRYLAMVQGGRR
ncbi:MAG: transporter related [Ilumatobacteraceae bacterium]|nr:transporter related [Ilumatobacteraceae bacterium]